MTTRIWTYSYFFPGLKSKNLVFHVKKMSGCSISENFNFLFVDLHLSYEICFELKYFIEVLNSYEFFSENSPKMHFLENYRKFIFLLQIGQFPMSILLFSIARNLLVTFLNHDQMIKNKF